MARPMLVGGSPTLLYSFDFAKIRHSHSVTPMPHEFFNPWSEVEVHGSDLPHWQQEEALQFVTFRLKDSLPQEKLREWKQHRKD